MFSRHGLRFRMAVSYVIISAAAVLAVEAVVAVYVAPQATSSTSSGKKPNVSAAQAQAEVIARADGRALSLVAGTTVAQQPSMSDQELMMAVAKLWSGQVGQADLLFNGLDEALATPAGQVVLSSRPAVYPVGATLPPTAGATAASGTSTVTGASFGWATSAVTVPGGSAEQATGQRVIGLVYARFTVPADSFSTEVVRNGHVGEFLLAAVLALVLLIPLGVAFGLLSTRRLIARIRRLASGAAAMAGGDLQARVPVSGDDEVGVLESGFNQMVEQLDAARRAERDVAGAEARLVERTRITRELHDSISQDLFSLSLVSGNLHRTLPDGTRFQEQAGSMVHTIDHTMREMRAMLLELRPVALEQAGLVSALQEVCRSYEVRLGIRISADLHDVHLDAAAEHTVLRVVQEALSNATRHGGAQTIELTLLSNGGHVDLVVHDDGRGFDPDQVSDRHGLGLSLMRERVAELGGTVAIRSRAEQGTTVRIRIPGGRS
jgi:signal transduction histidine kinase